MTTVPAATTHHGVAAATDAIRRVRMVPPVRRTPFAPVARRVLQALVDRIEWGSLRIELPDGQVLEGGRATSDTRSGHLVIRSEAAFHRIARRRQVGFGEAWVAGELTSPDLPALLEVLARNLQILRSRGILRTLATLQASLPALPRRNTRRRARTQIGYHYDVGNALYERMLDPSMTYSCAIFEHADQTLEEAQVAKYRAMCERLRLAPGQRVLEVGCGWGGFAIHAAREHGVHVTAVTLSHEQHAEATARVRAAGLQDLVDVQLRDYRTIEGEGTFDRIASIEMLEAVGTREYPTYFRTLDRLLADDGIACVQVIGFQDREYRRQRHVQGWIRRYIFPGGFLPSLTALTAAATRSSRLMVHEVSEIGQHYAPTLAHWRRNLLARAEELREFGCDDQFVRTWEYYLAYCEAGFVSQRRNWSIA